MRTINEIEYIYRDKITDLTQQKNATIKEHVY